MRASLATTLPLSFSRDEHSDSQKGCCSHSAALMAKSRIKLREDHESALRYEMVQTSPQR